jgi:rhodanese-related sulfurtransferase
MYDSAEKTKHQTSRDIFPNEAWELISKNRNGDGPIVIDVSTPIEYRQRHIGEAINVNLFSKSFKARFHGMDKNATYIVYCKLGGRSKVAQKLMQRFGFQNVYSIIGGTLLWKEKGLPFAPGFDGTGRFSFCPFSILIATFRKMKKFSQNLLLHIPGQKSVSASVERES